MPSVVRHRWILPQSPGAVRFKRLLGGWRSVTTFFDIMILLVPPSHELRVLLKGDPRDVVPKLRIAPEDDGRDVPLDPPCQLRVGLRTQGDLGRCERLEMLVEERNRGDREARPSRVFNYEIIPAFNPTNR